MHRALIPFVAVGLLVVAGSGPVLADSHEHENAQATEHNHAKKAVRSSDVYPLLVDPLGDSLVDVEKPVSMDYEGRNLHFASEENTEAFKADPDKYLAKVDQLIIKQQKPLYPMTMCVVSGEKLGGDMGEPVDYVYGNRLVEFCCKMCKADFNKDPDKYLAKINEAVTEKQKPEYPMDTCVVSGEKLGGDMGEPVDYVIGDRLVEFCCPMCIKKFEANPAPYLSKLDAKAKHRADEHGEHDDQDSEEHGHADHD